VKGKGQNVCKGFDKKRLGGHFAGGTKRKETKERSFDGGKFDKEERVNEDVTWTKVLTQN